MRELVKVSKASILILVALFLFVGCNDDDGGGRGAVAASDPAPDPAANISVSSFSAPDGSVSDASFADSDHPVSVHNPEPMTLLLVGSGLLGLAGLRRKLKR